MNFRTFDPYGKGSDGTQLVPGQVYMARATGAPDKNGVFRKEADSEMRQYIATRNGSLFSMWYYPEGHNYVFPHYMEFK